MKSDEDLGTGVAALFAALAMALDDEEHKLTTRFRAKLAQVGHGMSRASRPPGAIEMLRWTDDFLHVFAENDD